MLNIANCELGQASDNSYFHIVNFKTPINNHIPINSDRYKPIKNADNTYNIAYELVNSNCLTALNDLGSSTSIEMIYRIVQQLFNYFYMLHDNKIINKIFQHNSIKSKESIKIFMKNICTITEAGVTFLFRHTLTNGPLSNSMIYKKQSILIQDIIIHTFYRDTSNISATNPCTFNKCKFKNKIQTFKNFDYKIFHQIFCIEKKNYKLNDIKCSIFLKLLDYFCNDLDFYQHYYQLMQ